MPAGFWEPGTALGGHPELQAPRISEQMCRLSFELKSRPAASSHGRRGSTCPERLGETPTEQARGRNVQSPGGNQEPPGQTIQRASPPVSHYSAFDRLFSPCSTRDVNHSQVPRFGCLES